MLFIQRDKHTKKRENNGMVHDLERKGILFLKHRFKNNFFACFLFDHENKSNRNNLDCSSGSCRECEIFFESN